MTSKKSLRVATADDTPAPPMSIADAAEHGSELDQLIALRRRIATVLDADTTLARDMASLSKRLMEITKEIHELQSDGEDEFSQAASTEDEAFNPRAV